MRQLSKDMYLVDGEGFPQGMTVKSVDSRDKENGELVTTKIHYIRKRPGFRLSARIDSPLFADLPHSRQSDGRRFQGFRIQQLPRRRDWEGQWAGRGRSSISSPQLQTCVYMKGGVPVHYTRRVFDLDKPCLDVVREDYAVRQAFRVPRASLPKASAEQPPRKPNTICVNIWEEFLFGKSVITSRSGQTRQGKEGDSSKEEKEGAKEEEEDDEGPINYVRRVLIRFLPRIVVDLIVYTAYFLVFFASCVGYNMYCELGCYILLAQHLKIHEKAYEKKLDVEFTGSIFQGPLYALTRNWCEHCNERDQAQVMMRLMSRMKADILPTINAADTTPHISTKDPP